MSPSRRQLLSGAGAGALALAAPGCGFILYPERDGQGREDLEIDPVVVVLDGLLCLLFLVPGLVAFAVDIATGCIYLPPPEPIISHRDRGRGLRRRHLRGRRAVDIEQDIILASGCAGGLSDPRLLCLPDLRRPLDAALLADIPARGWPDARPASALRLEVDAQGHVLAFRPPA